MAIFMECKDACSQSEQPQNTCLNPVFMNSILFITNNFSKARKIMLFFSKNQYAEKVLINLLTVISEFCMILSDFLFAFSFMELKSVAYLNIIVCIFRHSH